MREFYPVFGFLAGFITARIFSSPHRLVKKRFRSTPVPRKSRPISFRISR